MPYSINIVYHFSPECPGAKVAGTCYSYHPSLELTTATLHDDIKNYVKNNLKSHNDAKKDCQERGGHLAYIETTEEWEHFKGMVQEKNI